MEWRYLESEALKTRYVLAAHYLRDCDTILEVGGYKTPITGFLTGDHNSVVVVDPLVAPSKPASTWRHVQALIEHHDVVGQPEGFLWLGMDASKRALRKIRPILLGCKVIVIEFPPRHMASVLAFRELLKRDEFEVTLKVRLDLSDNDFGDLTDSYEPHPVRELYVLRCK